MFCIACGTSNPEHARFCLQCGTTMYEPEHDRTKPNAEPERQSSENGEHEPEDGQRLQTPPATPGHAQASARCAAESASSNRVAGGGATPSSGSPVAAVGAAASTSSETTYFIRTLEGTQGPYRVSDLREREESGSLSSGTACRVVGSDAWTTVGEVLARSEPRPSHQSRARGFMRGRTRGILFAFVLLGIALAEVFRSVRRLSSRSVDAYEFGYLIGHSAAVPVAILVIVGLFVAIAARVTRRPWLAFSGVASTGAVVLYAISLLWLPSITSRYDSSTGSAARPVGFESSVANESRARLDPPMGTTATSPGEGDESGTAQPSRLLGASYVRVHVPHGVSVELPRNWKVLSDNFRTTLDALVGAKTADQAGAVFATSDLNFAANLYDDQKRTIALANFRFYPAQTVTQEDVAGASDEDLAVFDRSLAAETGKGYVAFGGRITRWWGTRRVRHLTRYLLVSEYSRSGSDSIGPFRVQLVRVLNGSESFTFTISYAEKLEPILRPICDSVISSLRF